MANLFKLEDKIKLEAQKYYTDGSNTVTDEEFDELCCNVRDLLLLDDQEALR